MIIKTVAETKQRNKIVVLDTYTTAQDIVDALEDINTQHTEDSVRPTKAQRKKLIRQKIAERDADIRLAALNKFFEE